MRIVFYFSSVDRNMNEFMRTFCAVSAHEKAKLSQGNLLEVPRASKFSLNASLGNGDNNSFSK
jgi:hypothetical protein